MKDNYITALMVGATENLKYAINTSVVASFVLNIAFSEVFSLVLSLINSL